MLAATESCPGRAENVPRTPCPWLWPHDGDPCPPAEAVGPGAGAVEEVHDDGLLVGEVVGDAGGAVTLATGGRQKQEAAPPARIAGVGACAPGASGTQDQHVDCTRWLPANASSSRSYVRLPAATNEWQPAWTCQGGWGNKASMLWSTRPPHRRQWNQGRSPHHDSTICLFSRPSTRYFCQ